MRRWRYVATGLAVGTAAGGAVVALASAGAPEPPARRAPLPAPERPGVRPALAIPAPRTLRAEPGLTRWAPLRRSVTARVRPSASARVRARIARLTPEGTQTPLPVLARRRDAAGRIWLRVRLPVLPNGTTGWVPRRSLGAYELETARLIVDRQRLRARLVRGRTTLLSIPIGVGKPRWPTPPGRFIVRNRLERFASPQYGPVAFGTDARSPVLTDWPAGGFIGIHGTDRPGLLPGRVSHGCIRMRNADILRLARIMPVGTPVTVL
jgi:lipoprotein-anchoring transpeptidase ErfK/SrfK